MGKEFTKNMRFYGILALGAVAVAMRDSTLDIVEVEYSSEPQHRFLGTPSIVKMPDGAILASYEPFYGGPDPECAAGPSEVDVEVDALRWAEFGGDFVGLRQKTTPPDPVAVHYTFVKRSVDNGSTWSTWGSIEDMHFMTLFRRSEESSDLDVWGLGMCAGGYPYIAKSEDGGKTWSTSVISTDVVLNTGATPVVESNGRVFRSMEQYPSPHHWPSSFQACMFSAPSDANLSDPSVWMWSSALPFNSSWIRAPWTQKWLAPGYLEGNAVLGPDGKIWNVLRVNSLPYANVAARLQLSEDFKTLTFVDLISFPGGMSKFSIRHDPVSNKYVTFSNNVTDPACPSARNILTISTSTDLKTWTANAVILQDDSGLSFTDRQRYAGFHYVDWQIDGQDAILAVRTAYRGADSYHNSNRLTFKRVQNFRSFFS